MNFKKLDEILHYAEINKRNTLTEPEAYKFLQGAGIETVRHYFIDNIHSFMGISSETHLPFSKPKYVLKVVSPDICHKTEVGGVKIADANISSFVESYYEIIKNIKEKRPDAQIDGVLLVDFIEEAEKDRNQLLASFRHDRHMGPVLTFGQGGIFVELDNDISSRILPATKEEIRGMVKETRIYKKSLGGYRGLDKLVEEEELVQFLTVLSEIATHYSGLNESKDDPYIIEDFEINPLVISNGKLAPVDCLIKFGKKEQIIEQKANTKNLDTLLFP